MSGTKQILSIENQIDRAILNHKRGKIFFPSNFAKIGSSTAIRKALNRIEKRGKILRLAQGIYLYPKQSELVGNIIPSLEEIAEAIAQRDKARIIPTGVMALNKLGLSTQVPLNVIYLTDATPRVIRVGKRRIKFKIASPKLLAAKSEICVLIIQALRELGEENITPEIKRKISEVLQHEDPRILQHDLSLAPVWIKKLIINLHRNA